MAVAALVVAVEGGADRGRVGNAGDRHLDVVALARVAHLGVALEQHLARPKSRTSAAARFLLHGGEDVFQRRRWLSLSRPVKVLDTSSRASASSMPTAEKLPGSGGMTTVGIDSSRASALACSGPPPP